MNSDLINRLRKGDEKAYKFIYDNYYQMLCNLAYQYVKDDFLSESFVSDVIFNLWEQREKLVIHTSIKYYLIKSVQNRSINYLEQQKIVRKAQIILAEQYDISQQQYSIDADYPLAKLITSELEDALAKAIDSLPEECREVFLLSRNEDLTYTEIASRLDISVNTVKYHMKNALSILKDKFKDYLITLLPLFCFLQ